MPQEATNERPEADYRDLLDIALGQDDDDSFRRKPKGGERELEERTIH